MKWILSALGLLTLPVLLCACAKTTDCKAAAPASSLPPVNSAAVSTPASSVCVSASSGIVSSPSSQPAASRKTSRKPEFSAASRILKSSTSSADLSITYDSVSAVPLPEGLIDGMKNPKSLMLSGFAPRLRSVPTKNEDKTAAKVQSMLASALPYSGTVPRSPKCKITSMDYLGPCFLTVQTQDGHEVQIEPYAYETFTAASLPPGEFGGSFGVHYVPDLLEITVDGKTAYYTAHDLYTWLQSKQCISDFDLNHTIQRKITRGYLEPEFNYEKSEALTMKILPVLSAVLVCGLIASSCAVKNTSLSRPVSFGPSEFSSAIPAVRSEPAVSSMTAIPSVISSATNKTSPSKVPRKVASTAEKKPTGVSGRKAAKTTLSSYHLPATNMNPHFVLYQHRIYLTSGPFAYNSIQHSVKPGTVLAHFTLFSNIPGKSNQTACAAQGTDPAKGICIRDFNSTNKYPYYPYLCDETVVVNGHSYHFTGGIDFVSLDASETQSAVSAAPSGENSSDEYTLDLNILSPIIPTITNNVLGPKIGTIPGGTVYAIDEIDPSEAIIIHSGSLWLTATKRYGYTGKTIDQVEQEKGSGPSAVIWH